MSAWDDLLDTLDRCAAEGTVISPGDLTPLVRAAQDEGLADAELDTADAARWLSQLLATRRELEAGDDGALSTLRVIVTRWLHPPRLDLADRARQLRAPGL